ncbi:hypothetical protein B0H13DRAFT_1862527 [Mycena leptocephala]|nr:hypothetical protein B0H13DRAFT_1862527 [Mycena leptocephala]
MSSFFRILTFLKVYFGDVLSHVVTFFSRGCANKSDSKGELHLQVDDLTTDGKSVTSDDGPNKDIIVTEDLGLSPELESESTPTDPDEPSAKDLLSAAVAVNLETLPSLPSLFKFPEIRLPVDMLDAVLAPQRQDFGAPSNLYYDHRLPLGTITNNLRPDQAKGMRLNTEVKPRQVLKTKSKSRGRRSRSKNARPVQSPVEAHVEPPVKSSTAAVVIIEPVPSVNSVLVAVDLAPPPSLLNPLPPPAQRSGTATKPPSSPKHATGAIKSRRLSGILFLLQFHPSKRHSAPPVLVASSKASRSNLQDRLSALLKETEDTIAAIDEEKVNVKKNGNVEAVNKDIRSFSAVALEEGQAIFIIGDDEDEEEAVTTTSRTSPQDHHPDVLPTINPDSSRMIASISASRSMTALASASSRSISDLLNAFDDAMASPRWRRLLSRSDDIARRNDSIV